jgi:hypothetical protein
MSRTIRGTLYGAAAVLALAAMGSLASRAVGFDYALLTPVSLLIFAAVGAYVGATERVSRAAIVGAVVGVIDATVGWAIAWVIGPGRPQADERITLLGLFNTAFFVALLAAAGAAVGAWLMKRVRRRSAA